MDDMKMKIENGKLITDFGTFKVQKNDLGYPYIRLEGKTVQVSRLMHDYWVFPSEGKGRIEFIDGNRDNLDPCNLRLASQSWLSRKAQRNNHFEGRAISHSKIAEVQDMARNETKAVIARRFGVTPRTIRRVCNGG